MSRFNCISPLDFRYSPSDEELKKYFSESASIHYQLKVEAALSRVLAKRGICPKASAAEIELACQKVLPEEVVEEEKKTKHNIRALVNCIRKNVSDASKPYIHFTTTSHDIICTAEAARLKEAALEVLVPELKDLLKILIDLSLRERSTLQIGRTHGQHAEPITFGFALAEYVARLGGRIASIQRTAENLRGKIAGAVGAYNASSLFFSDPEEFEKEVLAELNLKPGHHSTQVVEPEYMVDFMNALTSTFGVFANLADDMRNLQRSEIAEVAEAFGSAQVGSSTMPHKRNPWHFENVKSFFKEFMPRMITVYLDQISEHQRDLTNSASSRFNIEIIAALLFSTRRLSKYMGSLIVDKDSLSKNFSKNKDFITAEPLYILLAFHNHPDAHEYVKQLTLEAQRQKISFTQLAVNDPKLQPYLAKFTPQQKDILKNPEKYVGIAENKTQKICNFWSKELLS